ncbi:hypothetical protein ACNQVK_24975 [Mycobacterium sp. 134]
MTDLWPQPTSEPISGEAVLHRQLRLACCAPMVDRNDFDTATPAVIDLCD